MPTTTLTERIASRVWVSVTWVLLAVLALTQVAFHVEARRCVSDNTRRALSSGGTVEVVLEASVSYTGYQCKASIAP